MPHSMELKGIIPEIVFNLDMQFGAYSTLLAETTKTPRRFPLFLGPKFSSVSRKPDYFGKIRDDGDKTLEHISPIISTILIVQI